MSRAERPLCPRCKIRLKPRHSSGKLAPYCTECDNVRAAGYRNKRKDDPAYKAKRKAHRDKKPHYARAYHLQRKYNITVERYAAVLAHQNSKCAICGRNEPYNKHLAVDHCHTTGAVRGLLCTDCNRMIGLGKDNPETLRRAANYLEAYSS